MFDRCRAFLLAVLTVVAVSSPLLAQTETKPAASQPLKIGFSIDSLKIERWQTDLDDFQKRAHELGADVMAESAEGDDELQFQQSQKLIDAGIKVLVLMPHNTDKAVRIVEAAKAKHVAVLDYERLVHNGDVDVFVGVDPYMVGVEQAMALTERAPKGNYMLMGGSPADANARSARAGQMYVLKPLVDRGDIKIVADVWVPDWDPSEAYLLMAQAIDSTQGNITAVVASNDGTAGGAIQALEDHKLAGKILISGQDADLAAIVRILIGTQTMTVYKPIASQAALAAEAAVKLAKGESISSNTSINNGVKNVPAVLLSAVIVTKDNIKQTVVKDGFQKIEMIKQGLPKEKWSEIE